MEIFFQLIFALFIINIALNLLQNKYKINSKNLNSEKDKINKINSEIKSIKEYVKKYIDDTTKSTYVTTYIKNNINSIINTTIIKRYNIYYRLENIPTSVYQYIAIKKIIKESEQKTSFNNKQKNTKNYYNILGVTKNCDFTTIKKSYRNLMKEYHPDKIQKLPEDKKKIFEEKSKDINEAYAYFQKMMK